MVMRCSIGVPMKKIQQEQTNQNAAKFTNAQPQTVLPPISNAGNVVYSPKQWDDEEGKKHDTNSKIITNQVFDNS